MYTELYVSDLGSTLIDEFLAYEEEYHISNWQNRTPEESSAKTVATKAARETVEDD